MKKLILMFALILSVVVMAQEEKESKGMWIGGTVGFTSNGGDADSSSWTLGPQWGMMIGESTGIGVNAFVMGDKNGGNSTTSWEIAPYYRKYFGNGDFKLFADGFVAFGGGEDMSSFGVGIAPGVQYWFNSKWSMAAGAGALEYSSTTTNKDLVNEETINTFDLGINFASVSFSLFYHF